MDRGALDKLLERASVLAGPSAPGPWESRANEQRYPPPDGPPSRERGYDDDDFERGRHHGKRRRRGWLDDLFHFD